MTETKKLAAKIIALSVVFVLLVTSVLAAFFAGNEGFRPNVRLSAIAGIQQNLVSPETVTQSLALPRIERVRGGILVHHVSMNENHGFLNVGEPVQTSDTGAMHLAFDGANVIIAPNSNVILSSVGNYAGVLDVKLTVLDGSVFADVYRPLNGAESFVIYTPASVISVLGTAVQVTHDSQTGISESSLLKGAVSIACLASNQVFTHSVAPGEAGFSVRICETGSINIAETYPLSYENLMAVMLATLLPDSDWPIDVVMGAVTESLLLAVYQEALAEVVENIELDFWDLDVYEPVFIAVEYTSQTAETTTSQEAVGVDYVYVDYAYVAETQDEPLLQPELEISLPPLSYEETQVLNDIEYEPEIEHTYEPVPEPEMPELVYQPTPQPDQDLGNGSSNGGNGFGSSDSNNGNDNGNETANDGGNGSGGGDSNNDNDNDNETTNDNDNDNDFYNENETSNENDNDSHNDNDVHNDNDTANENENGNENDNENETINDTDNDNVYETFWLECADREQYGNVEVTICNTNRHGRIYIEGTATGDVTLNHLNNDPEFLIRIDHTLWTPEGLVSGIVLGVHGNVIITQARTVVIEVSRNGIAVELTVNLYPCVDNGNENESANENENDNDNENENENENESSNENGNENDNENENENESSNENESANDNESIGGGNSSGPPIRRRLASHEYSIDINNGSWLDVWFTRTITLTNTSQQGIAQWEVTLRVPSAQVQVESAYGATFAQNGVHVVLSGDASWQPGTTVTIVVSGTNRAILPFQFSNIEVFSLRDTIHAGSRPISSPVFGPESIGDNNNYPYESHNDNEPCESPANNNGNEPCEPSANNNDKCPYEFENDNYEPSGSTYQYNYENDNYEYAYGPVKCDAGFVEYDENDNYEYVCNKPFVYNLYGQISADAKYNKKSNYRIA